MFMAHYRQPSAPLPPAVPFRLTYSPSHFPNGIPRNPTASRQVLAERRTAEVMAPSADAATWAYERDHDVMVTACTRLQEDDEENES